jgi:tetratricopeptide (TPR) repeat protein
LVLTPSLSLHFRPHTEGDSSCPAPPCRQVIRGVSFGGWFLGAWFLTLLAAPLPAWSETPGNVLLEPSEQLFCVLAALNAAGYDAGLGANPGDDTRQRVRAYLEERNAAVVPELQKFYSQHHVQGDPGADLGQYISLALLLDSPPDFKFAVPPAELPPDARDLVGFIPLLRTFYHQGRLLDLWAQVQPRYDAAVARYTEAVRNSFVETDAYFRFPAGGYLGRTYTIYIDLLGAPEQVQARIYGSNYYLVVTPSKEPKIDEIRHQYLHFLIDPLAAKYTTEINQKGSLRAIAVEAPLLSPDFKEDFPLLVTECLIRAAELRMDKRPQAQAEKSLTEMTAAGLILVRYFYDALGDFARQDASMTLYYKQMILNIDPRTEQKRLFAINFARRPPAPAQKASPALSEEDRLLDQGDALFFRGKYAEAKPAYQAVLERIDPKNPRALYGLAVVYANTRKPDLAEEYFQKTLSTARDLRIVTWSHIYLGRLYDLRGKRDDALAQYHAAALTAAAYPLALRAVQSGLARAFGSTEEGNKGEP